jgi:hypothetical protein
MNARNRDKQYKRFLVNIASTTKPHSLKEQVLATSSPPLKNSEAPRYPKMLMIQPTGHFPPPGGGSRHQ